MSVSDEEEWLGVESHLVPTIDPGEKCNGQKTISIQGPEIDSAEVWSRKNHLDRPKIEAAIFKHNDLSKVGENEYRTYFAGYCNNPTGFGRDTDEGRCKYHHNNDGKNAGAPKHNQNGVSTMSSVDPHHYAENLPPEEEEFIEGVTAAILDRVRRIHGREPDFLDHILAKRVSINLHMLSKASDYSKDELVQVIIQDGQSHEETGPLVEEVRRFSNSIMQNLEKLGVLEDPESKKADAAVSWREWVKGGQDSSKVIDAEELDDSN